MPDLWMPGAIRAPQPGGIPLNRSLPPRVTWHSTSDRINEQGYQPPIENVDKYLQSVAYYPHLIWDPVTGWIKQGYPADVGARALSRWNEDGEVNIQIEVYFSPGALRLVKGKPTRFDTIAQTPCHGLESILSWTDGFGIPRVWPIAAPNGRRQEGLEIWNARAGHYAHGQVPGENHTDPGLMPSLGRSSTPPQAPTPASPIYRGLLAGIGGLRA